MTCVPGDPLSCAVSAASSVVGAVAGAAATSTGNAFADAMRDGAAWVVKTTIGWWIEVPSIDLTTSAASGVRGDVLWLSLVVAAAGVTWQGLRMALARRVDPMIDVGRGLVTLALWAGIGIIGPNLALRAGDSFASWVLDQGASGQVAARLINLASLSGIDNAGAVIVLGLVVMVAGLVQAVLMMFREGAVVVLAGVLVLAAAGSFTGYGRPWLGKVLGWMLALITYKPVAALVYAVALQMTGTGTDPRTVLIGLTMIVMSVVALPALMKFFTWATGTATATGPGLAGAIGLSAAGLQAAAALRGAGSQGAAGSVGGDASGQAAAIRGDLGPPTSGPTGASGPTLPPGPSGGSSGAAATAGATASPAAGASGAGAASGSAAGASAVGATGAAAGAATGGVATAALAGAQLAAGAAHSVAAHVDEATSDPREAT